MSEETNQEQQRKYQHFAALYAHRVVGDTVLFDQLTRLRGALLPVLEWGLDHCPQDALDFVWRVYRPLIQHLPFGETSIDKMPPLILKAYTAAIQTHDRLAQARFARVQGDWSQMSSWATARQWYEKALALYQPDDNGQEQLDVLFGLRTAAGRLHDAEAAERYANEISAHAFDLRHSLSGNTLRMLVYEAKDLTRKIHFLEALATFEEENHQRVMDTWRSLAHCTAEAGRLIEAQQYYNRLMQSNETWNRPYDLWGLGEVEYRLGNREEGCRLCELAILERKKDLERWTQAEYEQKVQQQIQAWQRRLDEMGCQTL